MTSSIGKEIEELDNAHVSCLMYKLISSSRDSDDLSIGFQGRIDGREKELTNNNITKGNYLVRNFSKVVFGFAEQQDSCTYSLG